LQTFPAKAELVIEHRYQPSVGGSARASLGSPDAAKDDWFRPYKTKYCMDSDFLVAIDKVRKAAKAEFGAPYSEERISYILKTGANWSGAIKDFRLVGRLKPGQLLRRRGAQDRPDPVRDAENRLHPGQRFQRADPQQDPAAVAVAVATPSSPT
jgi:hypothetical protein